MAWRLVLNELIGGFLMLPIWWYTRGLALMSAWTRRTVRDASRTFALGVWVKNLFVPMYGETEWSGRAISVVVRAAMIVGRGFAVGIWSAFALLAFALYVCSFPAIILGILYHGVGLMVF